MGHGITAFVAKIPAQVDSETGNHVTATQSDGNIVNKLPESQTLLENIIKTLHGSEYFSSVGSDKQSRFWIECERIAKQSDEAFLERYNGELDVQLIFAGLFSATNALLTLLIQGTFNKTFMDTTFVLSAPSPPGSNPVSLIIVEQALGYLSLSLSLLAVFDAVLGKQWLGYFKIYRFGHCTLKGRNVLSYERRAGIEQWHLHILLDMLPLMPQLSLLRFGISLIINVYTKHPILGSLILALYITTLGGFRPPVFALFCGSFTVRFTSRKIAKTGFRFELPCFQTVFQLFYVPLQYMYDCRLLVGRHAELEKVPSRTDTYAFQRMLEGRYM
ncbi:hypothetical protein M422DRAFT_242987 [Sphaerobolus stellatus SS14]|nr:hypothetical protein M422DRAFT_242987 [Sphaerobolus stellatus SS14]